MTDNAINTRKIHPNKTVDYYTYLFDKYNITKERFDMSVKYYCFKQSEIVKIYQDVLDELLLMETELQKQ